MIYLLLTICAGLQLLKPFLSQTCTRGSIFSLRIDDHYDKTILSAQVETPSFLSIPDRSISKNSVSMVYSKFPISLKAMDYNSNFLIILETQSLLLFDLSKILEPVQTQHYKHPLFSKYNKIATGTNIVLYNSQGFALFTFDENYPNFIIEVFYSENIGCIGAVNEIIIVCGNDTISTYTVVDVELGFIQLIEKLSFSDVGLTELKITDIYIQDFIYVLEKSLGLIKLSISPLKILNFYNIYGNKLGGFKNLVTVDGKYEVDLSSSRIREYNTTAECKFLGMDLDFIYCGLDDKILYISRLVSAKFESSYKPIKSLMVSDSFIFVGNRDNIEILSIDLGPIYIQGKTPKDVMDFKVKFTV